MDLGDDTGCDGDKPSFDSHVVWLGCLMET